MQHYNVTVYNKYYDISLAMVLQGKSLARTVLAAEYLSLPKKERDYYPSKEYDTTISDEALLEAPCGPLGGDVIITVFHDNKVLIDHNELTDAGVQHCWEST